MRDQRSGMPRVERRSEDVQFVVLALLLDPEWPGPWSLAELAREVGCEITTADAVVRLRAAGLVHRVEGLVFAARPAVRFCQLLRE
jgi:hypothetical protein